MLLIQAIVVVGIYPLQFIFGVLVLTAISIVLGVSKSKVSRVYFLGASVRILMLAIGWAFLQLYLRKVVFYPSIGGMSIFQTNLLATFVSFLLIILVLIITEFYYDYNRKMRE